MKHALCYLNEHNKLTKVYILDKRKNPTPVPTNGNVVENPFLEFAQIKFIIIAHLHVCCTKCFSTKIDTNL